MTRLIVLLRSVLHVKRATGFLFFLSFCRSLFFSLSLLSQLRFQFIGSGDKPAPPRISFSFLFFFIYIFFKWWSGRLGFSRGRDLSPSISAIMLLLKRREKKCRFRECLVVWPSDKTLPLWFLGVELYWLVEEEEEEKKRKAVSRLLFCVVPFLEGPLCNETSRKEWEREEKKCCFISIRWEIWERDGGKAPVRWEASWLQTDLCVLTMATNEFLLSYFPAWCATNAILKWRLYFFS